MFARTIRNHFQKVSKKFNKNRSMAQCPCPSEKEPKWEGTYNDLPQPDCSWAQKNAEVQGAQTRTLIIGVGILVGTIGFGIVSGMWENYNYFPDRPADKPQDYTGSKKK